MEKLDSLVFNLNDPKGFPVSINGKELKKNVKLVIEFEQGNLKVNAIDEDQGEIEASCENWRSNCKIDLHIKNKET